MWESRGRTPFVLKPKHAALFRVAAIMLSDEVGWDERDETSGVDVTIFDGLTQGQKQAAILIVSRALLDPEVKAPAVNAALAGTLVAVYVQLKACVEVEIDVGRQTFLRGLILEALDEIHFWTEPNTFAKQAEKARARPAAESDRFEDWSFFVLDVLLREVLDDDDYSHHAQLMDLPPDRAAELKRQLNIDPDYFVDVVEDPTPDRVRAIQSELRSLLDRSS